MRPQTIMECFKLISKTFNILYTQLTFKENSLKQNEKKMAKDCREYVW